MVEKDYSLCGRTIGGGEGLLLVEKDYCGIGKWWKMENGGKWKIWKRENIGKWKILENGKYWKIENNEKWKIMEMENIENLAPGT